MEITSSVLGCGCTAAGDTFVQTSHTLQIEIMCMVEEVFMLVTSDNNHRFNLNEYFGMLVSVSTIGN